MKTASLTYQTPHYIDTAPLAARYEIMVAAILACLEVGRLGDMLRYTHKVVRLVRVFTRLEAQNVLTRRKLDMLIDKPWRERVLRELGGLRKLTLWEAVKARIETRATATLKPIRDENPSWLHMPDRIAESERLKARVRECGRATAHPLVFRDKCKMDFEGEFRLAPLPRGPRGARRVKVYTQNTIVDYVWNNIPFAKEKGFGPASVWPVEFYAAMELGGGDLLLSSSRKRGSNSEDSTMLLDPRVREGDKEESEDDKLESKGDEEESEGDKVNGIPLLPLHLAITRKSYRDCFEDPV